MATGRQIWSRGRLELRQLARNDLAHSSRSKPNYGPIHSLLPWLHLYFVEIQHRFGIVINRSLEMVRNSFHPCFDPVVTYSLTIFPSDRVRIHDCDG